MTRFFSKIFFFLVLIHGTIWGEIQVTNLLDLGPGSLRQALTDAENGEQIVFNSLLSGLITLLSPLPTIAVDVEIIGPNSNLVAISGNSLEPVFDVGDNIRVLIANLNVLAAVTTGSGAGLSIGTGSTVTLSECSFSNCVAVGSQGGAIHVGGDSSLKASEVSFTNNSSGGPGDDIFLSDSSVLQYACSGTVTPDIELYGTGTFFKLGLGEATFRIPSSSPLTVVVQDGTLISTGVRTEPTIVYGSLIGDETSLYLVNYGTFKPSETIGTSITTGDYHQTSSGILEVAISPSTQDVLQVGGNAYLAGTLSILPEAGVYNIGDTFTILTTGGAINSTFDSVISSQMTFNTIYYSNRVDIQITAL